MRFLRFNHTYKLFVLFVITNSIHFSILGQQPNDCINSVTVCGNSNFSLDVSGIGTQELSGSNTCSSQENNSIWLEITMATDGTLAFTLTPGSTNIGEDYDFFLFGPNVSCGSIGQAVRCSTTNPVQAMQGNNLTGMSSASTETSEGPSADGDSFVSDLDVLAGETYFLVIDRAEGSSAFSIEWTGTATFPDNPSNPLLNNPNDTEFDDLDICDGVAPFDDFITNVDLAMLTQAIVNGESDVIVSYHISESDANINTNPLGEQFNTFGNNQTVYVRIQNTTSNCFIINTFNINVTAFTNFSQPSIFELCDDDSDGDDQNGSTTFDFNLKTQEITTGFANANYAISYHLSLADAESDTNELPLNYTNTMPTPTEIFVRIEDLDTVCIGFTSFVINVASKPIANDISLIQCDEDGIPEGFTLFNLNEANDDISGGDPDATIIYYISQNDAENNENPIDPDAFENFFNPQIIYTRVTNTNTGCVSFSEVSLEVSTTASNDASISVCDYDGNEDGFATFNLNDTDAIVLAGAPAGLPVSYYETYNDALLENNPLGSTYTNTVAYNQIIYARVENNNACYGISDIELTVFELPNIETTFETVYCLNFSPQPIVLDAGIINDIPGNFFYQWSTGETTAFIEIDTPGTYTVRVSNTDGCFKDRTINVLPSNVATITNVDIVDASENNTVSIIVSGEGDYEYALVDSNGPYQDSNTFTDVEPGLYTVYVRDKNNCGISEELISVIGFPKFFTPNDDTVNDFWQVKGISNQFQAGSKIYIFNRHGKLLTQLDPVSRGWDGTYNGNKMPTSDYWFKVTLQDGRTFTSHFTLKR